MIPIVISWQYCTLMKQTTVLDTSAFMTKFHCFSGVSTVCVTFLIHNCENVLNFSNRHSHHLLMVKTISQVLSSHQSNVKCASVRNVVHQKINVTSTLIYYCLHAKTCLFDSIKIFDDKITKKDVTQCEIKLVYNKYK